MIWIIILLLSVALFLLEVTCGGRDATMAVFYVVIFTVLSIFCYYISRILSRIVGIDGKSIAKLPAGTLASAILFTIGFVVIFLAEIFMMDNTPTKSAIDALRASGVALVVYKGLLSAHS